MTLNKMIINIFIKNILFVILLIFTKQTKSVPPTILTAESSTIIDATEYIINNFYIRATATILISHKSSSETFHSDIINEIIPKIKSVTFLVDILTRGFDYQLWFHHVLVVDGAENFKWLSSRIKRYDTESFYLILLVKNDGEFEKDVEDILNISWHNFMINVNILVEESPGLVIIYSFFPYNDPHNCTKITPVIINRFENASMEYTSNIFPKKLTSMNKCPFYITTWNNPPYDIFRNNTVQTGRFHGLEGDLIDAIGANVNFTPKIIVSEIGRGVVYVNGTATGSFKKLQNEANVSAGSIRSTQTRAKFFTTSTTFHEVAIVFIVNDEIFYGPIARLMSPFDHQVWIFIAGVLIIGGVIILILEFVPSPVRDHLIGKNNSIAILNMLSGVLGGGITVNTATDFSRYLLLLWLIVTTVLRSTYQGALYDFLRTDKTVRPPETINELLDREYKICASSAGYQLLEEFPHIKAVSFITPGTVMQTRFELILQQAQTKLAVVSPEDFIRYYSNRNPHSTLHIIQERLLIQNNCVLFRKGSFFAYSFDEIIKRLFYSGIVQHIVSRYADINNYDKNDEVNLTPKIFDNSKIAGAYQIFAVMCILSVLVFILELLSVRFKPLKKLFTTFR